MTTPSTSRLVTSAAALAGLLVLEPVNQAQAASGASVRTTTTGTQHPGPRTVVTVRDHRGDGKPAQRSAESPFSYGPRVVRDHRKDPQPWGPPRHAPH
jgi:hypothetical protein